MRIQMVAFNATTMSNQTAKVSPNKTLNHIDLDNTPQQENK